MTEEKQKQIIDFLNKPRISIFKLLIYTSSIIYAIAIGNTPDKIIINIAWMTALLVGGMSVGEVKELLGKLKMIMLDPDKTLQEKFNTAMEVVLTGCAVVGALHEEINAISGNKHLVKKLEEPTESEKNEL